MMTNSASTYYASEDGLLLLCEDDGGMMSRYDWCLGERVEDSSLLMRLFSGNLDIDEVSEGYIAFAIRRRATKS